MAEVFQTQRPQFVLFGSSLVQYGYYTREGWGAVISHLYSRKANTILRGYAAWNTRRALDVLPDIFPKEVKPALVIVHFGSEDSTLPHSSGLGPYVPVEEYITNLTKIATYLKELSKDTRLIFLSTPPVDEEKIPLDSDGKKPRTNEKSKIYSNALLKVCQDLGIDAIDLFSAIRNQENWQDCFIDDGVNLSAEGNTVVYQAILATIKERIPSLYWTNMISEFGEDSDYDPVGEDGETTSNASNYAFPHPSKWGEPDYEGYRHINPQFF